VHWPTRGWPRAIDRLAVKVVESAASSQSIRLGIQALVKAGLKKAEVDVKGKGKEKEESSEMGEMEELGDVEVWYQHKVGLI
jgi:hypothetical protein